MMIDEDYGLVGSFTHGEYFAKFKKCQFDLKATHALID